MLQLRQLLHGGPKIARQTLQPTRPLQGAQRHSGIKADREARQKGHIVPVPLQIGPAHVTDVNSLSRGMQGVLQSAWPRPPVQAQCPRTVVATAHGHQAQCQRSVQDGGQPPVQGAIATHHHHATASGLSVQQSQTFLQIKGCRQRAVGGMLAQPVVDLGQALGRAPTARLWVEQNQRHRVY